ncbi:hypothetical protein BJV74DRAFT_298051 [Russula compacta]|nr:hypothetical protein BJV74DRAFT_298051 [Russula compacta]
MPCAWLTWRPGFLSPSSKSLSRVQLSGVNPSSIPKWVFFKSLPTYLRYMSRSLVITFWPMPSGFGLFHTIQPCTFGALLTLLIKKFCFISWGSFLIKSIIRRPIKMLLNFRPHDTLTNQLR